MISSFDVDYKNNMAHAACLVFEKPTDKIFAAQYTKVISDIAPYEPGKFFKRELPCLISLIELINEPINTFIVDGYVWLNNERKPGLGAYLYEHFNQKIAVIGVAKRSFANNDIAIPLYRGESTNPLYITSAGISQEEAKSIIFQMYGDFREPLLLKQTDQLSKNWLM